MRAGWSLSEASQSVITSGPGCSLVLIVLTVLAMPSRGIAEAFTLPDPLTLQAALDIGQREHPDVLLAEAERDRAAADLRVTESDSGLQLSVRGEARYIEPASGAENQQHNDSRLGLELDKRLYDFGLTPAREAADRAVLDSRQAGLAAAQLDHRLDIIRRYLDVLLADHEYRLAVESVVTAFVERDKVRDRHELGQRSDIDLLQSESDYAELDAERNAARARQRSSRALLVEALGVPEGRPEVLVEPDMSRLQRQLPELGVLMGQVLEGNSELRAARAELDAAQQLLLAGRAGNRPVISARAGRYEYQRDLSSRDDWQVGIALDWPLFRGGRVAADTARALSDKHYQQAQIAVLESDLRERVTQLWEDLQVLRSEQRAAEALMDYRELYLDRSRSLYELEVATDLGDAMVESTRARLRQAQVNYRLLLTWAELDLLQGKNPLGELQ